MNIKRTVLSRGASLVEYALLAALVAVLCIVAIRALGNKASVHFSAHASQLSIAVTAAFHELIGYHQFPLIMAII